MSRAEMPASPTASPPPAKVAGDGVRATSALAMSATTPLPTDQNEARKRLAPPVPAALLALVRALGRQAAREDIARHQAMVSQEQMDGDAV